MTKRQELIAELLAAERCHPTAEDLLKKVRRRMPSVAQGTVYRNLKILCQEGRVRKIPMSGAPDRYDGFLEPHDHLCCRSCGRIADIPPLQKAKSLERRLGVPVEGYELLVYYVCPECLAKRNQGSKK